jgi:SAM-dependent methyltransferase
MQKSMLVTGRDHYNELYNADLEAEAQWLQYGAEEKVNSVEILLSTNGIQPYSIVELGCGTGALISEMQRRKLAHEFTGVDSSARALDYLRSRSDGIRLIKADITESDVLKGQYGLLVSSHVLEHLEEPRKCLAAIQAMDWKHAVFEVPLEDLFAGKLKARIRDRTRNLAGHVSFFTAASFERLLGQTGFKIRDERQYVPISTLEALRFVNRKNNSNGLRSAQTILVGHYLPRLVEPLWRRYYYSHLAVLCARD